MFPSNPSYSLQGAKEDMHASLFESDQAHLCMAAALLGLGWVGRSAVSIIEAGLCCLGSISRPRHRPGVPGVSLVRGLADQDHTKPTYL